MSWNGSGVAVINSSGQPVVANTSIDATVFNAFTADVATMLNNTMNRDGQSAATGNQHLGGYRVYFDASNTMYLVSGSGVVTFAGGKFVTPASASAGAGFNLTAGSAPSSPADGDVWSTTAGIYARINGTTIGPFIYAGGALGTPASGVATNLTGTASGLTAGISNALKSATTTVDVSAATAPTVGQILTATGGTAATWQAASGGGIRFLGTVTASGVASVDVETTAGFDGTYDTTMIDISNVTCNTGGASLTCRMKIGGSYITTSTYSSNNQTLKSDSAVFNDNQADASAANIVIAGALSAASTASCNGTLRFSKPTSTAFLKKIMCDCDFMNSSDKFARLITIGGESGTATALTGIRFAISAGTFSGTFRVYGLATS